MSRREWESMSGSLPEEAWRLLTHWEQAKVLALDDFMLGRFGIDGLRTRLDGLRGVEELKRFVESRPDGVSELRRLHSGNDRGITPTPSPYPRT